MNVYWGMHLILLAMMAFATPAGAQDTLDEVKNKGVLVVGVRDAMRPFGFIDDQRGEIVGYDIDFARAIAGRLGVKLQLLPSNRPLIPLLQQGRIDLIAGAMTKTVLRMDQIDFSHTYYVTGQKFLAMKGTVRSTKDLEGKKIATSRNTNSERNLMRNLPNSTIIGVNSYQEAFQLLKDGKVTALSTDEALLQGLLAEDADRAQFEIPELRISIEPYALGVRKGSPRFLDLVNRALLDLEQSGEAARIYERWFGSAQSPGAPAKRDFKISAGN